MKTNLRRFQYYNDASFKTKKNNFGYFHHTKLFRISKTFYCLLYFLTETTLKMMFSIQISFPTTQFLQKLKTKFDLFFK